MRPKRGHGTPQPRFGLEVQLDKIAETLGIDPAELRLRHRRASRTRSPRTGCASARSASPSASASVVERSGWTRAARQAAARPRPRPRVLVVSLAARACRSTGTRCRSPACSSSSTAAAASRCSAARPRSARARTTCWRRSSPRCSASTRSTSARVTGDTDLTPVDLGSYSSRVTLMMGNAAIQAAERARELARRGGRRAARASRRSGSCSPSGRVFDAEDPARGMTLQRGGRAWPRRSSARSARPARTRRRSRAGASTRAAASARRRRTPTPRAWSRSRSIRRPAGSRAEGLDRARHRPRAQPDAGARPGRRQRLHGPRRGADGGAGVPPPAAASSRTRSCTSSRRCSSTRARPALDMPEVVTELIEDPDPNGPFGAKEVGQGPLLPVMPAVANAVYDAVGVRIDEVPITPEKILKALDGEGGRQDAARRPGRVSRQSPGPSRCSCRRRGKAATATRVERDAAARQRAQSRRRRRSRPRRCVMMRLPRFALPRAARRRRGRGILAGERRRARCWSPAAPTCCRT